MRTEFITTAFELVGLVLLAVAVGMALWLLAPAAGVAGAALVLLAEAALVELRRTRRRDVDR